MKNYLIIALFSTLLSTPLLVLANATESSDSEYLNLDSTIGQDALNIEPTLALKPSDLNQWGSNWGNKIPFKHNAPHDVAAYGVDITSYFPKF